MYVYTYTNVYIYSYMLPGNTQECVHVTHVPLTEEIRLQIFGSRDLTI